MKVTKVRRLRILYVLLLVLIGISVLPLWFYGSKMMSMNKDKLETQEGVLQTITSQSLAQVISLYMDNLNQQLKEFFDTVGLLASKIPAARYASDANLRLALESFVADRPSVLYATVLNNEARGVQAGNFNAAGDAFLRKALEAAFVAARQGQEYQSNPITVVHSGVNEPVLVMARPIKVKDQFLGMVGAVVTLVPVTGQLQETYRRSGLEAYVVDNSGRLVASHDPDNVSGMDMVSNVPIVQEFLTWGGRARVAKTSSFEMQQGGKPVTMFGTYAPTQKLGWGVIVQRKVSEAYFTVFEMRKQTFQWGLLVILLSLVVGFLARQDHYPPH